MEGKDAFKYSLKRDKKVKTLPTEISVKFSGNGNATIDSYLSFQRLIVLTNGCNIRFGDCKWHELWPYLPALFECTSLMEKAEKTPPTMIINDFIKSKSDATVIRQETE